MPFSHRHCFHWNHATLKRTIWFILSMISNFTIHICSIVQCTELMSCLFAEKYMWFYNYFCNIIQYSEPSRLSPAYSILTNMFKYMILLYKAKYMHADFHANVIKLYNYITVSIKVKKILTEGFFGFFFYVLYSTLLHLPPLRFHCVGECSDRTQDCCYIGSQTL